jgi:two-component system KDP operon response regulator KdpE
MIVHTRPYSPVGFLKALSGLGLTTIERPYDAKSHDLIARIRPGVVILAMDPAREIDIASIRYQARASDALQLVLAPALVTGASVAAALDAGADACLSDRDEPAVLAAQVMALLRRQQRSLRRESTAVIQVEDLMVDFDRREISDGGRTLPLSPTEFKIVAFLARNAGKVFSPAEILAAVLEVTYSPNEARETVKVHVRRIRQKLEAVGAPSVQIVNARGFGFTLRPAGLENQTSRLAA